MKSTLRCVEAVELSTPHRITDIEEALFQSCASFLARYKRLLDSTALVILFCFAFNLKGEAVRHRAAV
jgi:hypothetical protein